MTALSALARDLRLVLGPGIGLGVADPREPGPPLWPEEAAAAVRMVEKRRREFGAGRAAARAAMADLGEPASPVLMGRDRAPIWPGGLRGSIAHSSTAAVAVVARMKVVTLLGIDVEEDTPLPHDLWPEILAPSEQDWLMCQPSAGRGHRAKEVFSAKEAIYKAQYPATGRQPDFLEVEVTLDRDSFRAWLPAPLPMEIAGRIVRSAGLLVCFCAARSDGRPIG